MAASNDDKVIRVILSLILARTQNTLTAMKLSHFKSDKIEFYSAVAENNVYKVFFFYSLLTIAGNGTAAHR